ncbi:MAG: hypothetical protein LBD42_06205 [Desulfovibrio sp.]|jgi:hypothetical protein|nr:hypothetical protein [Desulfovibrio sp.]
MRRPGFSDIEYGLRKRTTKREEFLKAMDEFIPWVEWVSLIESYYPSCQRGRPPMGVEKMLRMYLLMRCAAASKKFGLCRFFPHTNQPLQKFRACVPCIPAAVYAAIIHYRSSRKLRVF